MSDLLEKVLRDKIKVDEIVRWLLVNDISVIIFQFITKFLKHVLKYIYYLRVIFADFERECESD